MMVLLASVGDLFASDNTLDEDLLMVDESISRWRVMANGISAAPAWRQLVVLALFQPVPSQNQLLVGSSIGQLAKSNTADFSG